MARIAYRRVSTTDQNTSRQLPEETFDKEFEDKASAKDTDRPALKALIDFVRDGDIVVVHSIDRLARNLADLEKLIQKFNTEGVTVEFRKESLTFSGGDDPMQTLLLQMLGAVAQFERSMTRERQREGIAAAKQRGDHLGRPSSLEAADVKRLRVLREKGVSVRELQDEFNISRASVYRLTA